MTPISPCGPSRNGSTPMSPRAKWIRDSRRPLRWAVCQPDAERFTDLFRPGRDTTGRGQSDHLDWRPIDRLAQPSVGKVEVQHPEQNVDQGATNVGRRATAPDGRKGYETDEIVDTPLRCLTSSSASRSSAVIGPRRLAANYSINEVVRAEQSHLDGEPIEAPAVRVDAHGNALERPAVSRGH